MKGITMPTNQVVARSVNARILWRCWGDRRCSWLEKPQKRMLWASFLRRGVPGGQTQEPPFGLLCLLVEAMELAVGHEPAFQRSP